MVGEVAKNEVLRRLAGTASIIRLPKTKVKIGNTVIHTRFRSSSKSGGNIWSFNINPNTLTADFELWVCGSSVVYYLIPRTTIERIYNDPAGYPDYAHDGIRVADINSATHMCSYGRNRNISLATCFLARL